MSSIAGFIVGVTGRWDTIQPPSIDNVATHPVIYVIVSASLVRNNPRAHNDEKADNAKLFFDGEEKTPEMSVTIKIQAALTSASVS